MTKYKSSPKRGRLSHLILTLTKSVSSSSDLAVLSSSTTMASRFCCRRISLILSGAKLVSKFGVFVEKETLLAMTNKQRVEAARTAVILKSKIRRLGSGCESHFLLMFDSAFISFWWLARLYFTTARLQLFLHCLVKVFRALLRHYQLWNDSSDWSHLSFSSLSLVHLLSTAIRFRLVLQTFVAKCFELNTGWTLALLQLVSSPICFFT